MDKMNVYPNAKDNFLMLLIAKRRSGKTEKITNIVAGNYLDKYDEIYLFYPHDDIHQYKKLNLKPENIFKSFTVDKVNLILDYQDKILQQFPNYRILMILDDVISGESFKSNDNTHPLNKISICGRHKNISIIMSSQIYTGLSRCIRTNADYIILFRSYGKELDLIIDEFRTGSKKEFTDKYIYATQENYACLAIDNINGRLWKYDPIRKGHIKL